MNYNTTSISKGCFVFNETKFRNTSSEKVFTPQRSNKSKKAEPVYRNSYFRRYLGAIDEQYFFCVYRETWMQLKAHIDQLQNESQSQLLEDIVQYTINDNELNRNSDLLPTIVVLTGVNQPDHLEQFETLGRNIQERTEGSVCLLPAQDCSTVKSAIENLVFNFLHQSVANNKKNFKDLKSNIAATNNSGKVLKRSQCTMRQLKYWYQKNWPKSSSASSSPECDIKRNNNQSLVIILPDFECFPSIVLHDFLQILSRYCNELPFVLIIGVATSISALYETLPYHVTCHLHLRIYQAKLAPARLNEILDNVFLSAKYAFRLSGRVLKFLTHIFLHYDFSINGFIQSYKGNIYALCSTNYTEAISIILNNLIDEDFEDIRQLLSFRPYVEKIDDARKVIALLTDNNYLKKKVPELLQDCHQFFMLFRIFMEFLFVLIEDLPKGLLVKCRSELYILLSMSDDIINRPEFKECWQILAFMSREAFCERINRALNAARSLQKSEMFTDDNLSERCNKIINEKLSTVAELLKKKISVEEKCGDSSNNLNEPITISPPMTTSIDLTDISSRADLKSKLLEMSKSCKLNSNNSCNSALPFTQTINEVLNYIRNDIIKIHLQSFSKGPPLYELFVFSNIGIVQRNTIGAPRAALHLALNDPHYYLQCECCKLDNPEQIKGTLPDISVMYKLHLECGRSINIYDWLQSFHFIVDDNKKDDADKDEPNINSLMQARFTYAMAELQFLGYIKMSKTKTDHATRLTW